MSKSLQQILGHMPLTETLRTVANGVPNPFPSELFTVSQDARILGDRAKYVRVSGERKTSTLAKYGAPSRRRALAPIADQDVRMMHTFEDIQIDPVVLQQLRSFEQWQQDKGLDWLKYQFEFAGKRVQNTRVITAASTLRYGAIYWDANGNLLPSSSGAAESFSFGVPATHQNQCNSSITASWALSNTDIPGNVRNLQQYAIQETGMELETALYGIAVPYYMTGNDYVSAYLSRNASLNDKFLGSGEIPDGMFGIKKWIPVYTSFYEDADGTVQEIWADDLVVFMPAIGQPDKMTWWKMFEGSFPVPRSIEVQRTPEAALGNFETAYGQFSYAAVTTNPPGMTVHYGDVWLPGLRNEKAIFQADVAF